MPIKRRRQLAMGLALAMLVSLALLCCACGHAVIHHHDSACPLCQIADQRALQAALISLFSAFGLIPASIERCAGVAAAPCLTARTPVARKVRLND